MKTVAELLRVKPARVVKVQPEMSVLDAIKVLASEDVGAVIVMTGERLAGILSERDVARKITLSGKIAQQTPASEIMTERVTCAAPDLNIRDAMQLMTDKRVRHLPIVNGDQVVGVVSIGDLVKAIIDDQEFTIEQLQSYIVS